MEKFLKIPSYIPLIGILTGLALIVLMVYFPNTGLLIAGVILFHLCGWWLALKFFVTGAALFSSVLSPD